MSKVDVCINVYGKIYQTLVTIKSLLLHSGDLIDKIYFIEEAKQPETFNLDFIKSELNYDNIIYYKPKHFLWINATDINRVRDDIDYRLSLRYQYGIENTDKKYLLIIHNDVLFTDNIVKAYLEQVDGYAGIGQIGQCWNCPINHDELCNGDKHDSYNPTYSEVINLINKYPNTRTYTQCRNSIDKINPMPLPECRLNEMHCLIDMDVYRKEVVPNGDVVPFGGYFKLDLADEWFRQLVLKGYKFKNVDVLKWCFHSYFNVDRSGGHPSLLNDKIYHRDEQLARIYYNTEFKNIKK